MPAVSWFSSTIQASASLSAANSRRDSSMLVSNDSSRRADSLITTTTDSESVLMDRYHNDRGQWCLAVEDDTSRRVFDMIETDASSARQAVELLDSVGEEFDSPVPILEVVSDHGSEFVNPRRDNRPDRDHEFERYLHENDIEYTLCKVGRPQSNGKIERFFQTYEKHRQRFGTLDEFLTFYNEERPHMSLDWDRLEMPAEAFGRLVPSPAAGNGDPLATEVTVDG
jgi:putative transposase